MYRVDLITACFYGESIRRKVTFLSEKIQSFEDSKWSPQLVIWPAWWTVDYTSVPSNDTYIIIYKKDSKGLTNMIVLWLNLSEMVSTINLNVRSHYLNAQSSYWLDVMPTNMMTPNQPRAEFVWFLVKTFVLKIWII